MEEFLRRYRLFADRGWKIKPTSYRADNPDGTRAGWIAQVYVVRGGQPQFFTTPPLLEPDMSVYATEEEANGAATWLGLQWLEANADAQ